MDKKKGAVESQAPGEKDNMSTTGQLGHRDQDLWLNLPTPISLNPAKVPSIAANQRHPIGKSERGKFRYCNSSIT